MNKENNGSLSTLLNLGNTCYINSVIQILRHTTYFNDYLNEKNNVIANLNNEITEWNSLRKLLWKENGLISPKRWIHIIKLSNKMKDIINNYNQQDVSEYLINLLDIFHDCLKRPVKMNIQGNIMNFNDKLAFKCYNEYKKLYENNFSEIINLFYGMEIKKIEHLTKHTLLSVKVEHFSILNLSIPHNIDNPSLIDCFNEYCKSEILTGDNMWYNEKNDRKEEVNIKTGFFKLPDVLIICIKQYTPKKKLISCPLIDLDLTDYTIANTEKYIYDLYAVCNHIGNLDYGHYVSIINYDNKWYKFDDSNVQKVANSSVISSNAYCLFYKKKRL